MTVNELKPIDFRSVLTAVGNDFISPQEVESARGIIYTTAQLKSLERTFPSAEALVYCQQNNYAVMPAPPHPLSLFEIRALNEDLFFVKSNQDGHAWYTDRPFFKFEKTSSGWLAICKESVQGSCGELWEKQESRLVGREYVPTVTELGWFATTYYLVRKIALFDYDIRTATMIDHDQVAVLRFGQSQFNSEPPCISITGCRDYGCGAVYLVAALKI